MREIRQNLYLVTAPVEEPVGLEEAKAHCRVDHTTDDAYIRALLESARQHVENYTRRKLITQTWDYKIDRFPCGTVEPIELPHPPLQSVTSVKYLDISGVEQTWPASEYIVTAPVGEHAERGRISLADGKTWPDALYLMDSVRIRFVCGYGDAAAVPSGIKQAILLRVGDLYTNREPNIVGTSITHTKADEMLLWPYRSLRIA